MPKLAEPDAVVEQLGCRTSEVPAGSTCRTRGGKVAPKYHTPRFTLVPQLRAALEVRTPADRGPGRAWEMGTAGARRPWRLRGSAPQSPRLVVRPVRGTRLAARPDRRAGPVAPCAVSADDGPPDGLVRPTA
ncbi:hypothetical protein GCM10018785_60520 [Streptomyces longispororuber]|uniref:DNA-binding phage zinc finger domain-containing protein n=1 Tax=Streptomyces longispororuber TaxID=68230 RepID=A0A919DV69_9ACTN|nr:hypothetical protein GCM10018785_60520 [Streptomyces longispororuber]